MVTIAAWLTWGRWPTFTFDKFILPKGVIQRTYIENVHKEVLKMNSKIAKTLLAGNVDLRSSDGRHLAWPIWGRWPTFTFDKFILPKGVIQRTYIENVHKEVLKMNFPFAIALLVGNVDLRSSDGHHCRLADLGPVANIHIRQIHASQRNYPAYVHRKCSQRGP